MKIKQISPNQIEVSRSEDGMLLVSGYAIVYNVDSKPFPVEGKIVVERVLSGACDDVLANMDYQYKDCVATYNHDRETLLARTSSGTLMLSSDDIGLKFSFVVPDTTSGRDLAVRLERGDLKNCSFQGTAKREDLAIYRDNTGNWRQDIKKLSTLVDVSLVVDSQYEQPAAALLSRFISELEQEEQEAIKRMEQETATKESQYKMLNDLISRAKL